MPSVREAEPLSVLVVDDDSALIRTLADILRLNGYAPSTAVTGHEGLALARQHPPALAVVDLRLPDMDGTELAAQLHRLSEMTQVVVLTGNASVESAVAALREHSLDYLIKPVKVEQLLQVASLASERFQRRQAEERLRESDQRFRRVVQSDMLGILFWDRDGIYDANDALLKMIGFTRDDVESGVLKAFTLTPPEYRELDDAKRRELAARGIVAPYEKEFFTRDGGRVPVLVGATPLEGRAESGVAFVLDITERRRAAHALEARARQQAAVAAFGQQALIAGDVAVIFYEAAYLVAETLELPIAGVLERRVEGGSFTLRAGVGWRTLTAGQTVAASSRTFAGTSHSGGSGDDETVIDPHLLREEGVASGITVLIPGSTTPFGLLTAHDRRDREFTKDDIHFLQAIAHVVGTAVDRSRAESAFRQTQRLEAVGRLAGGISHDFNNVLTAITGFAGLVREALPEADPLREDIAEILKAANRAAGLTRQLLAFSRQQVLEPRLVLLNDTVRQMEKMLRPLLGPEVELKTQLGGNLGLIEADPGKLEQVLLNLCVNARDAMPDGGSLTIETANAEFDNTRVDWPALSDTGKYVMLAVSDTGIGMDPDTQARVFEPYFTTKGPDKGTGLGLATVYGIVKQSGGEILVRSERNFGTTFAIYLPRVDLTAGSGTEFAVAPLTV
jgi:PAS domain S-box-containing protein